MVMAGLMLKSLKIGNKFSKNIRFECELSGKFEDFPQICRVGSL